MGKRALVILGAGASYDMMSEADEAANADWHYRPPLTQDLFDSRPSFQGILDHYPDASVLAEEIRTRQTSESPEALLREFSDTGDMHIAAQFREVPLYLQELLTEVSRHYLPERRPPNYAYLVNRLLREFEKAAFVTLNYDLFLERVLSIPSLGGDIDGMDWYTHHDKWSLTKLHGSANWDRRLLDHPPQHGDRSGIDLPWIRDVKLEGNLEDVFRVNPRLDIPTNRWESGQAHYPQLVVPLEGKSDFSCPPEHIEHLQDFLSTCKNVLVIGLSGKDEGLFGLLSDSLPECSSFFLVGKPERVGEPEREESEEEYHARVHSLFRRKVAQLGDARGDEHVFAKGFSAFIENGGVERFAQWST